MTTQKNLHQIASRNRRRTVQECPYDLILGRTSMAQLSAWQDYVANKLYLQQISIPLTVRNNIRILHGKTGILTLTL